MPRLTKTQAELAAALKKQFGASMPDERAALARPSGSPSEAFDKWDGKPPTSGYGRDLMEEEYDRADRKRAFLAGARCQRRMMANGRSEPQRENEYGKH
jgi:hypothetical protein